METGTVLILALIIVAVAITVPILLFKYFDKKKARRIAEEKKAAQENEIYNFENILNNHNFKSDKTLHLNKFHFAVDTNNKKIFIKTFELEKILNYKDVISYELIEDGQTLTKGSMGNAVAGGILFGAAGAIVGSTMKKSTNVCNTMQLRITINDVINPNIILDIIKPPGAVKGGKGYSQAFTFAKEITSTLTVIQKQSA